MDHQITTRNGIICRLNDNRFSYLGWPSIARLDNNVLVAGCSGFRLGHLCPFGKTLLFYSFNSGQTWSPPVVVNDTPLDDRDVGLLALGGNNLLLSWFNLDIKYYLETFRKHMEENMPAVDWQLSQAILSTYTADLNERHAGSFIRQSQDGGVTWNQPVRLPVTAPHGPCRLADGRLLYLGKGFEHKESADTIRTVIIDQFGNWREAGTVPLPAGLAWSNFFEPHALQLPNGRIIAHIRFQDPRHQPGQLPFTIFQTLSGAEGVSWSVPRPLGVSGSPPHLIRHSSGVVICVFGRRQAPYGERVIFSADAGETWSEEWILVNDAPDGDLGYPASTELANGRILTVYYQKYQPGEKPSLLSSEWELPDFCRKGSTI